MNQGTTVETAEHIPRFSVIVPAHNSAAYIEKGLQSIKDQSFTDYELIIVCDNCTDNTADIARKYTDHVYEVSYGRDGMARNAGLDHSRGEWVLFMDDDDYWLHEYVFDILNQVVGKQNEDILTFSFIWRHVGYAQNRPRMWIAVWNKCWKRSFIGDTRFSDVPFVSDKDFHFAMMNKQPLIANLDMPMYYYNYMREGSQTEKHNRDNTESTPNENT